MNEQMRHGGRGVVVEVWDCSWQAEKGESDVRVRRNAKLGGSRKIPVLQVPSAAPRRCVWSDNAKPLHANAVIEK